jgi:RNA polymerase sigma factor (sigma-70 family)
MTNMSASADSLKAHERLIRHTLKPFLGFSISEEDLYQEASLAFVECLAKWRPDGGASQWTYARPRVLDALKTAVARQKLEASAPTEKDLLEDYASEDLYPSPEEFFLVAEQKELALAAVKKLNPDERELLDRWMNADSFESLADQIGASKTAAYRRVQNVLEKIRTLVAEAT